MSEYTSIKEDVLKKLEQHLPYIQEQFGIETIGVFGSVSRGDNTPDSDVDILISFQMGHLRFANLGDYLEKLLHRRVDLIMTDGISKYMRPLLRQR